MSAESRYGEHRSVRVSLGRTLLASLMATGVWAGSRTALSQSTSQSTRPIEVVVLVKDSAPRCEPQELRVPADVNVDLRIQNTGARSVLFSSPDWLKGDAVRTATNAQRDPNGGYVVAAGQSAQMIVKSPPAGQHALICAEAGGGNPQNLTLTSVK